MEEVKSMFRLLVAIAAGAVNITGMMYSVVGFVNGAPVWHSMVGSGLMGLSLIPLAILAAGEK